MEYLPLLYIVLPLILALLLWYLGYTKMNDIYLNFIISQIVQIVEGLKRDGKLDDKKAEAVRLVKDILLKTGLSVPDELIEDIIEDWVWTLYNQFKKENIKEVDLT